MELNNKSNNFNQSSETNPHISNQFEITEEEAKNNPSEEEIKLKETMENEPKYSPGRAFVNLGGGDFLNIRSGPGTGYGVVAKVSAWTNLKISGSTSAKWIKVTSIEKDINGNYMSTSGYVSAPYIGINDYYPTSKRKTTANVNMRTSHSASSSVITTIPKGTIVARKGRIGTWDMIWRGYSLSSGYCSKDYITTL